MLPGVIAPLAGNATVGRGALGLAATPKRTLADGDLEASLWLLSGEIGRATAPGKTADAVLIVLMGGGAGLTTGENLCGDIWYVMLPIDMLDGTI